MPQSSLAMMAETTRVVQVSLISNELESPVAGTLPVALPSWQLGAVACTVLLPGGHTLLNLKFPVASVVVRSGVVNTLTRAFWMGCPVAASVTLPTRLPHLTCTTIVTFATPSGGTVMGRFCPSTSFHTLASPCGTQSKTKLPSALVVCVYGFPLGSRRGLPALSPRATITPATG